jgi:hypothetical protein
MSCNPERVEARSPVKNRIGLCGAATPLVLGQATTCPDRVIDHRWILLDPPHRKLSNQQSCRLDPIRLVDRLRTTLYFLVASLLHLLKYVARLVDSHPASRQTCSAHKLKGGPKAAFYASMRV